MIKNETFKKMIFISLKLFLLGSFIFLIIGIWNFSWFWGWVIGYFASLISTFFNYWIIEKFNVNSLKKPIIIIAWSRFFIVLLFYGLIIIGIFYFNFWYLNIPKMQLKTALKPINIITFTGSQSIFGISILYSYWKIKRRENG